MHGGECEGVAGGDNNGACLDSGASALGMRNGRKGKSGSWKSQKNPTDRLALPLRPSYFYVAAARNRSFSLWKNGQEWIRTTEGKSQQIYSLPRLATPEPARKFCNRAIAPQDALRGSRTMRLITIFSSGKLLRSVFLRLISSRCSRPSSTRPKTVYCPLRAGMDLSVT